MQICIHVGPPKTGTSFLQRRVFPKLEGVFDVYNEAPEFLASIRNILVEENPLMVSMDKLRLEADRLLAKCVGDAVLISWENLFGSALTGFANNAHIAAGLKELFPDARIILSVRRQDAYAESAYRQELHTYQSVSPANFTGWDGAGNFRRKVFVDYTPYPAMDVPALDWTPYIDNYVRLFGLERVKILAYEALVADPAGYIQSMCDFMGVPPYVPAMISLENRSYSLLSCWIARALNRFVRIPGRPFGLIPWRPFHDSLSKRANGHNLWWMLAGISRRIDLRWVLQGVLDKLYYVPGHPFSSALRRDILAAHAVSNRAIDERFGLSLADYGYY